MWAIGDMVPGPALAHKASDEGIIAVEDSGVGMDVHPIDYNFIPAVTFCHPQVASFGLSEAAAKEAGYDVVVGKIPMGAVGAPTVYGDRGGMIKIVGDKQYGELMGASILSVKAADLIQELVNARELEGGYPEGRADHPRAPVVRRGRDGSRPRDGRLADPRLSHSGALMPRRTPDPQQYGPKPRPGPAGERHALARRLVRARHRTLAISSGLALGPQSCQVQAQLVAKVVRIAAESATVRRGDQRTRPSPELRRDSAVRQTRRQPGKLADSARSPPPRLDGAARASPPRNAANRARHALLRARGRAPRSSSKTRSKFRSMTLIRSSSRSSVHLARSIVLPGVSVRSFAPAPQDRVNRA